MSENALNETCLNSLCAAIAAAAGVPAPEYAAAPNEALMQYINGRVCDRIFLYNPDAIGEWIMNKYPQLFKEVDAFCELQLPYRTVMPSVTPVCFGTFYTGALPEVHGIRKYEKPVITLDTLFDAFLRAGKKCAIVALKNCSIASIFLNRDMDYYITGSDAESNAVGAQLILEDRYDLIVLYNSNYDSVMHKTGPESIDALAEARSNSRTYGMFCHMIEKHWKSHRSFTAFAMDHGCHEIDGNCGSHGLDMPEDLNIRHGYRIFEPAD